MHSAPVTLGIVDDHPIFRQGLQQIISSSFEDLQVTLLAANGKELQEVLKTTAAPDILLLDLRMPVMNGYDTLEWLHAAYPGLPVIVLTMHDTDIAKVKLIRNGVRAIVKKESEPAELRKVILQVKKNGYYYPDAASRKLMLAMYDEDSKKFNLRSFLTEKEWKFLQLAATELTYKQIAYKMKISQRAADKIRNKLFEKLGVQNRVVLAVKALKNGIVDPAELAVLACFLASA